MHVSASGAPGVAEVAGAAGPVVAAVREIAG